MNSMYAWTQRHSKPDPPLSLGDGGGGQGKKSKRMLLDSVSEMEGGGGVDHDWYMKGRRFLTVTKMRPAE